MKIVSKHRLAHAPSLLLTAAVLALPAAQANDTEATESVEGISKQLEETDTLLKQLQQDIINSRKQKEKITQSLTAVQGNVSERDKRLKQLNKEIKQYDRKLQKLTSRIEEQQRTIKKRKGLLADSLRKSQRVTTAPSLKVLLQHDDPVLADRLSVYTEYFTKAQDGAIDEQLEALTIIEASYKEAVKNHNWLHHIKKKAKKQYDGYAATAQSTKSDLESVEHQLTEKQRTVKQLEADRQRLNVLLNELKAAEVARSGYFASSKGKYAYPINGKIEGRFGELKSVGKIKWQGMFIAARRGIPVAAIADGEIVYSDWLQGFGNLVIVDHGDAFMTLYGGNRDVRVNKGDWVESGATIATVGNSGGQAASGVYFEIRHNAKPVDPSEWIDPSISIQNARR